jgi:undecaprenyl pyrophosphate phosphatase UppP
LWIRFLLRVVANHTLSVFAYYRFVLAVVAVVLLPSGT